MRKLAILLGTLAIAASAFAGGKEPVAPEVTTVVKETIVYKSSPTTGNIGFYYRVAGPAGVFKKDGKKYYRENGYSGDYGRILVTGGVNLTERLAFGFEARADRELGLDDKDPTVAAGNRFRAWFTYKHDFLDGKSRLWYGNTGDYTGWFGGHALEYRYEIPLAGYFFDNDFIKTTAFTVAPTIGYAWDNSGTAPGDRLWIDTSGSSPVITKGKYESTGSAAYYAGLGLFTSHALPLNFSFDFNVYAYYGKYNHKGVFDEKDSAFLVYTEIYLNNKTKLLDLSDSAALYFTFTGGYDPYYYASEKIFQSSLSKKAVSSAYSIYALPQLRLEYKPVENVTTYIQGGAEYRNWAGAEASNKAQGWTWAPTAQVGFTVSF